MLEIEISLYLTSGTVGHNVSNCLHERIEPFLHVLIYLNLFFLNYNFIFTLRILAVIYKLSLSATRSVLVTLHPRCILDTFHLYMHKQKSCGDILQNK